MLFGLLLVGLIANGAAAYAPLQWAPARTNFLASKRFVVPDVAVGHVGDLSTPLALTVKDAPSTVSPSMVPYFTAKLDETIMNVERNWCIEASGRNSGSAVLVNTCNGGPAQKWNFIPEGGRTMIQLKNTNKCIDVNVKDGTGKALPLQLEDCEHKESESWTFGETSSSPSQPFTVSVFPPYVMMSFLFGVALGLAAWMWQRQKSHAAGVRHGEPSCEEHEGVSLVPLPRQRRVAEPQMGLFGLGPPELAVIALVGLFILGPDKVKDLAKEAGKASADLKQVPEAFNEGIAVAKKEMEEAAPVTEEAKKTEDSSPTKTPEK